MAAVVVSCLLGGALLTIAWRDYRARVRFLDHAWPIRAEIVALEPVGLDPARMNPIAGFTTTQGDQVRVALPGLDLSPGDTVNLLYDAERPEDVQVNDAWALWFEPCAFSVAGALLVIVPLLTIGVGRMRSAAR